MDDKYQNNQNIQNVNEGANMMNNQQLTQNQDSIQQAQAPQPAPQAVGSETAKSIITLISKVFTKPVELFGAGLGELNNSKKSLILAAITIALMSLISIGTLMYKTMSSSSSADNSLFKKESKSKTYSDIFSSRYDSEDERDNKESIKKKKANIKWENLKNIKYDKVVPNVIIGYGLIVFGMSAIFYIGGLIAQKKVQFPTMLGVIALALIPYALISLLIAPMLVGVNYQISQFVNQLGMIYSAVLIYETMTHLIFPEFDKKKIYVMVGCVLLVVIGMYYVQKELLFPAIGEMNSPISSEIKDLTNKIKLDW